MELGLGTSTIRSLGRRASQTEVDRLIAGARALGVRYFDTADSYGAGSAERALGKALRRSDAAGGVAPARVISKTGYRFVDLPGPVRALNQPAKKLLQAVGARYSFPADAMGRRLRRSLARLRTDRVYAYCLHNPPRPVLERPAIAPLLASLRRAGGADGIGVSTDWDSLDLVGDFLADIDLLEVPASLYLARGDFFERAAAEHGVEVVVNQVSRVAASVPEGVARLAALRSPPAVVLVGTRSLEHLEEALRAARSGSGR